MEDWVSILGALIFGSSVPLRDLLFFFFFWVILYVAVNMEGQKQKSQPGVMKKESWDINLKNEPQSRKIYLAILPMKNTIIK